VSEPGDSGSREDRLARLTGIEVEYRARLLAWASGLAADVAAEEEGRLLLCPDGDPHHPLGRRPPVGPPLLGGARGSG